MPHAAMGQRASDARGWANTHGLRHWLHTRAELEPRVLQGAQDGCAPAHAVFGSQWPLWPYRARLVARWMQHLTAVVPHAAGHQSGRGTQEYVHDSLGPADRAAMGQAWQLHGLTP